MLAPQEFDLNVNPTHSHAEIWQHWKEGSLWKLPLAIIDFEFDKKHSNLTHIQYISHISYLAKFMPWRQILKINFDKKDGTGTICLRSMDYIHIIYQVYGEYYTKKIIIKKQIKIESTNQFKNLFILFCINFKINYCMPEIFEIIRIFIRPKPKGLCLIKLREKDRVRNKRYNDNFKKTKKSRKFKKRSKNINPYSNKNKKKKNKYKNQYKNYDFKVKN